MAYNNYGYSGYNAYYQQPQAQDQNHTQSPATHTQAAYQNSSNPYSQYNQYNTNQYATHQSSDNRTHQQYPTKSSIDNPSFQSNYGYNPQQYTGTATTRNDTTAGYQTYAPATQTSNAGYAYTNAQSTLDQNNKVFTENSALGNLAYASQLGRNASTINNSTGSQQMYGQTNQQTQQSTSTPQSSQSSSILPNPTHQQSYGQTTGQKSATPSIPQQPLYRSNVANQQRSQPTSATIRRSPSLPVKQNSISQQSTSKVISPHTSVMGSMGSSSNRSNVQSSNAHQISTIMNQSQDLTTSKANQQPQSHMMHTHQQNPMSVENRSPATMVQSPAITEIQQPTTIDPNAVFNHTEWAQKRRAIEDQEAAKRMKEHKAPPAPIQPPPPSVIQPAQTMVQPSQTMINPVATPLSTPQTLTPDQSKASKPLIEDDVRSEMKAFADKLRTWKSHHTFSVTVDEMWKQTLQGTNNSHLLGTRISSTPQLSRSSIIKGSGRFETSGASSGFDEPSLGSPFQTIYTDDMPDLGKFPAMRRRTRADKGVSRSAKAGQVAAARAITQAASPATILPNFGQSTPTGVGVDAGAESMRRAMQAFHQTPTPATPEAATPVSATAPKAKQQTTAWPEEQKPQLAQTAKAFLEMQPANKGKIIETSVIMQMLNQNPSYDNLCMMLASSGFSVPRAGFAQELLNIVPQNSNRPSATTTNVGLPEETPAKKPRGRPKKNSVAVTPQQETIAAQPVNGGSVQWGTNLTQGNMNHSSGGSIDLTNGDGEYNAFYEKMRLISGPSPSQTHTPIQQPNKKRNIADMGKAVEINGGPAAKKQQIDRQGSNKGQRE